MKIQYVEVSGFRGFRDKVRVDFGLGFTVITGRNGVGKSTLCDAIEFAITGSIDKYAVEKSGNEGLADYIWWRGKGVPEEHYVTVSFLTDKDQPFTITRRRENGCLQSQDEIRQVLCNERAPEEALRQLTRTTIIRDEWIAALSLDLTESRRFEFVRSALGAVEGKEYAEKADNVVSAANIVNVQNTTAYEEARDNVSRLIAQQTVAKDTLSERGDVNDAISAVSAALQNPPTDINPLQAAGRHQLADIRLNLDQLSGLRAESIKYVEHANRYNTSQAIEERRVIGNQLTAMLAEKDEAVKEREEAEKLFKQEQELSAIAASLTNLIEHGEHVGLHDEHCPLCAAHRTDEQFKQGIHEAKQRINLLSSGIQVAHEKLGSAVENERRIIGTYNELHERISEFENEKILLDSDLEKLRTQLEAVNSDIDIADKPDQLMQHIDNLRNQMIELQRALNILEASKSVSKISSGEIAIDEQRSLLGKLAERVSESETALDAAKTIQKTVKRVSAEIIDERLARISPLLNEIYQRLRPHSEWRTIDYSIRGDVRRFLSLKVGDGLNPQFVFSSGQRRAAGLAFLLSVHLSRGWSNLNTLVLDDPVQHIDDFRALQLIEVLAAMRQDGRQIICAVEDAALADLLSRRLMSNHEENGRRVDIDLDPLGSTHIANVQDVPPMHDGVLRRFSSLSLVENG